MEPKDITKKELANFKKTVSLSIVSPQSSPISSISIFPENSKERVILFIIELNYSDSIGNL